MFCVLIRRTPIDASSPLISSPIILCRNVAVLTIADSRPGGKPLQGLYDILHNSGYPVFHSIWTICNPTSLNETLVINTIFSSAEVGYLLPIGWYRGWTPISSKAARRVGWLAPSERNPSLTHDPTIEKDNHHILLLIAPYNLIQSFQMLSRSHKYGFEDGTGCAGMDQTIMVQAWPSPVI